MRVVGRWGASLLLVGGVVGGGAVMPVGAQTAGPIVAPVLPKTEDPSDRGVDANLYMQTSAEYRAACYQAYNLATDRLKANLAALRASQPEAKPAVVMDLDETVFDNAGYQSTQIRRNLSFDQRSWDEWESKYPDEVRLVPGAKEFILNAEGLGVTVFHVSNRKKDYTAQARSALARLGIPVKGDHQILLMEKNLSDKEPRRQSVMTNHAILLLVGDNLRDFDEQFRSPSLRERTPEAVAGAIQIRKERVDANRPAFGERWIILPNPAYGEWTRMLGNGRADLDHLAPSMGGTNRPNEGAGQDDAAIRFVIQRYVDARKVEDPAQIAALFTSSADQLVSDGTQRKGRDDLVRGMIESSRRAPAERTITVETIRLLSPEVALADGTYTQAATLDRPERALRTSITLLRTPEGWKIAAIRNMLPAEPAR